MDELFIHRLPGKCVGAITGQRFCKRVAGGFAQVAAIGDRCDAISLTDGVDGEEITFLMFGLHTVTAGGVLADGDEVMSDASGRAIVWAAGGGGRFRAGFADRAAAALGAAVTVQHRPMAVSG